MIDAHEEFELIRQAEKINLTNKQMKELQDWASRIRVGQNILDLLFDGYLEVAGMEGEEPIWATTEKGDSRPEEAIEYEDDDPLLNDDDFDDSDYDEDVPDDEINISHIKDPEKATQVLRDLLNKLKDDQRNRLKDNGKDNN